MNKNQGAILITGCSTGIGLYCAQRLQQEGWQVIASCRQPADVERLRQQGLTCIQLDLNATDTLPLVVQQLQALSQGRLCAIFHNGAYGQPGALEDLPVEALRAQFETNFFAWHELTRLCLPLLRKQPEARLILNSSVLGQVAMPLRGAYVASKYALEGWADTLRLELADTQVKVVLLEPGPIESQFRHNAYAAFRRYLQSSELEKSRFVPTYERMIARLERPAELSGRFTLGPEAVYICLEQALTQANPAQRYAITKPAKWLPWLKRLLPGRWLDRILLRAAD